MARSRALAAILCCGLVTGSAHAGAAKRIYVEPFATRTGAERLREDVTAEVRRLDFVSLVGDESSADLILGGGGEIWIKGYRSLNPRSGRLPSDGTPVYGGYLSVELRNQSGVTLWSDLVTPGVTDGDVSKDLARSIAKHLSDAVRIEAPAPAPAVEQPSVELRGAGATFPYPVYSKWFTNYRAANPAVAIGYEAIGSEAGTRKLLAGEVDFGASDSPDAIREIDPAESADYLFLPSVAGAVVPIVNVPGVPRAIAFPPEALAGIFLGRIKKWNDPILAKANRGLHLPDLDIVVVHRADGSGTSYAFSSYLSKNSAEWKARAGASLDPKWPVGRGAAGNEGVAQMVKELGGSIGYVEFIYALRNHLNYGKVRNRDGEFVEAGLESIAAAVDASRVRDDLKASIVDPSGPGVYPISTLTWFIVPAHIGNDTRRAALAAFLKWMLGPGQRQAAALGYLALPKQIVEREQESIAGIR